MSTAEKIVGGLVMASFMTAWLLFLQPLYAGWIESQGRTMGAPETFFGLLIPIFAEMLITWFLIRRIRRSQS